MKDLRVLHLIGGGDTGGAMSHLLLLLPALEREGCKVRLVCLGGGGLAEAARQTGLEVTVLPMRSRRDLRVLPSLRSIVFQQPGWDIVHTHGMRANLPTRLVVDLSRPLSRRRRPCLLTTVHSDLRLDYSSRAVVLAYEVLDRATLGCVDGIICASRALKEVLLARGYPRERLYAVPSGLDAAQLERLEQARLARVGKVSAGPKPLRLGAVARLAPVKDIDLLLEVAAGLRESHPRAEFVIAGDGPERTRLERVAADRGLVDTVRFTGPIQEVGPFLAELDVYLVTSQFEGGVSMAVLEAMAAGLPVVSTAAGGVSEAVVDGETGYVVQRGHDREALAAALAERAAALLDDPELRVRLGAAGAERVRSRFTIEGTAAATLRVYERCLAGKDNWHACLPVRT